MNDVKNIMVIGATSAIAEATTRLYANKGCSFYLVARNSERLAVVANDLRARGAKRCDVYNTDMNDFRDHERLLERTKRFLGTIDLLLIAYGTLPDQKRCQENVDDAVAEFNTNAVSVIGLLTVSANSMEEQGHGSIVVITSVAGDRGRQSNYLYGAAKGAVSIFLQGLRNRLAGKGVQVITIKPGFVDTPMTREFRKGLLWVGPDVIARGIYAAVAARKDEVYLPWFWSGIMFIIRNIPEFIFKRMRL